MVQILKSFQVILFAILLVSITSRAQIELDVGLETEKVNKRVGSLIKLKPEYEERYIILHKYTFPGVLDRISKSNIRNYSIFLLDGVLFSYFEYIGNDYEGDMNSIADSTTRDWWKLTDPMQEPLPTRKEGEWWTEMEQLLCLNKIIKPSPQAMRIGLIAKVMVGKEKEIEKIFREFPPELEKVTNEAEFQNCNVFFKDDSVYFYYEYIGEDIEKSMLMLNNNVEYKIFQVKVNNLLQPAANGYWKVMKEVFHTD